MFGNFDDKSKNQNSAEEKELTPQQAFMGLGAVGILLGGLWFNKYEKEIELFYFTHYDKIWMTGWALIVGLFWKFRKVYREKTEEIYDRFMNLSRAWGGERMKNLVGSTTDGVNLYISQEERLGHVQIVGATGRGKTESVIVPWANRDLERSQSTIIIDGKGSQDIADRIAFEHKAQFDLSFPEKSMTMNPLQYGSSQEITDRIFSSFEFEDPYYKSIQYDLCGFMVSLIQEVEGFVTFKSLYGHLTNDEVLTGSVSKCKNKVVQEKLVGFLRESKKEREKKLSGLVSHLSPFAIGEIAELVNASPKAENRFSLTEALIKKKMNGKLVKNFAIIISLPTLKYQQIASQLGKLILQEIAWAVGEREKLQLTSFTSVFLDEFSSFVYEGFSQLLNKARSSGVSLHLSHQSVADLESVSAEFAKSVNTNTNVKCLLGLNDPDTADFFARHLGTKTTEKLTERLEEEGDFFSKRYEKLGQASVREVESYKIHPNKLKGFSGGRGVIHIPKHDGPLTEEVLFSRYGYGEFELADMDYAYAERA